MVILSSQCRPQVGKCPECRVAYSGPPSRHRFAEMMAEELANLRAKIRQLDSQND